jgi:hypothetical protein
MKNPFKVVEWSVSGVILVLWMLFSIVYVGNGVWNNVVRRVYTAGMQDGLKGAVMQAIDLAQKCQPVILSAGEAKISLVNTECLGKEGKAVKEVAPEAEAETK